MSNIVVLMKFICNLIIISFIVGCGESKSINMDLVGEWTWSGNIDYHNKTKRENYIATGGIVDRTSNFLTTVGYNWRINLYKDGSTRCYINHKF